MVDVDLDEIRRNVPISSHSALRIFSRYKGFQVAQSTLGDGDTVRTSVVLSAVFNWTAASSPRGVIGVLRRHEVRCGPCPSVGRH